MYTRGLSWSLLALEGAGCMSFLSIILEGTALHSLFIQFDHHPWHGFRFGIYTTLLYVYGRCIVESILYKSQKARGWTWSQSWIKTIKDVVIFFLGSIGLCSKTGGLSFELWDVLTQLSLPL